VRQVKKTVCDFCQNGCHLGVSFDGYQYQIEYLTDEAPNYGRLCPRGNSANIVIDHPKRLSYPLLDGKEITWARALELIQEWRARCRPEEIAVVYSRGLTEEEIGIVWAFAKELGTENLVCGYLEPDNGFAYQLAGVKRAQLAELSSARAVLLAGDVFSKSPVAARLLLEARYADKNSRLVVVDSILTRQAGFAHLFIQVKPGTEFLALSGIAGIIDPKLKIDVSACAVQCGVSQEKLQQAARILSGAQQGLVGAAMSYGRVDNPLLFSLCAQLVALKADKPFVGFAEAVVPEGRLSFRDFRHKIAENKIRMLFWFGGLHPYSYSEVMPDLSNVSFRVATSIFRTNQTIPGLLLPVPSEFEKKSRGETLWEKVEREPVANPVSGSRLIVEIVQGVTNKVLTGMKVNPAKVVRVEEMVGMVYSSLVPEPRTVNQESGTINYLLLGERRAIGLGGFFDPQEEIAINPIDAGKLGVQNGDWVMVKTRTAEEGFLVKVSQAVPAGVMLVGVDAHKNRRLFSVEFDEQTGSSRIPPTKAEVWRAQR
jgi:hypothetical protein